MSESETRVFEREQGCGGWVVDSPTDSCEVLPFKMGPDKTGFDVVQFTDEDSVILQTTEDPESAIQWAKDYLSKNA